MGYKSVFLFTPGCFDKGGISRYTGHQIVALRKHKDIRLYAYSFFGPKYNPFEKIISNVCSASSGQPNLFHKIKLSLLFLFDCARLRPHVIILAHVNLLVLAPLLKIISPRTRLCLNIYGLELWSKNKLYLRFYDRFLDLVIADCFSTSHYYTDLISRKQYISVIWDSVNHDTFYREDVEKFTFDYVMTFGRLSKKAKHKGYHRLLQSFKDFKMLFPNYYLVFAGDGDMRFELEQLAIELCIDDSVLFTGYLTDDQAREYMSSARFFSLVSEKGHYAGEGIPLTPLEAMSCGTPIIVGNEDGSVECIQGNVGFSVDPRIPDESFQAMIALASLNQHDYNALSDNCLRVSRCHFGLDTFADKLYQALFP